MNVQELQLKTDNAAAKVEKCKGTIARHQKALTKKEAALAKVGITADNMAEFKWSPGGGSSEHYWAIVEVESKQMDIKGATQKLKDAETVLSNWKAKLDIEIEKERFLSEQAPAIIIEFLSKWKERARDWYIQAHHKFLELRVELQEAKDDAEARYIAEKPTGRRYGKEYNDYMNKDEASVRIRRNIAALGSTVAHMATYRKEPERLAWLEHMLEEDRKAKMLDLILRINSVVGTITDADYLRVSDKGNLDGIIIGENGKAKIETIGAGGYNIVCFHYRTLVHKLEG